MKDNPNELIVMSHGDENSVNGMNAQQLADMIRDSGKWQPGKPVSLYSCHTGNGDDSIGAQLSNELNTTVRAPEGYALYLPTGYVDTGVLPFIPIGGGFNEFHPK